MIKTPNKKKQEKSSLNDFPKLLNVQATNRLVILSYISPLYICIIYSI